VFIRREFLITSYKIPIKMNWYFQFMCTVYTNQKIFSQWKHMAMFIRAVAKTPIRYMPRHRWSSMPQNFLRVSVVVVTVIARYYYIINYNTVRRSPHGRRDCRAPIKRSRFHHWPETNFKFISTRSMKPITALSLIIICVLKLCHKLYSLWAIIANSFFCSVFYNACLYRSVIFELFSVCPNCRRLVLLITDSSILLYK